jgi:molybdenum cofactor cytidylyltransferase
MPAAARAHPELIRFPGLPGRRISHVHRDPASLAAERQHFAQNCNVVAGIILAAGRSMRMGTPKALLAIPPADTFVSRLIATFREAGISDPLVVGRPDDRPLQLEVSRCGAALIVNTEADTGGQLSSLLTGLASLDHTGIRGLMVAPVDAPLVQPATVRTLLAVFEGTLAPIVRPRYAARHGHPVVFSRAVFDQLRQADPSRGAKAVVRAHEAAIADVDVDDPGVLADIDTPASYRALFGCDPRPPQS